MKLTEQQIGMLDKFDAVLQEVTNCGLFDELAVWCDSPDSINDVCDAVDLLKQKA